MQSLADGDGNSKNHEVTSRFLYYYFAKRMLHHAIMPIIGTITGSLGQDKCNPSVASRFCG